MARPIWTGVIGFGLVSEYLAAVRAEDELLHLTTAVTSGR